MLENITKEMVKTTLKGGARLALSTLSTVLDKGAEYADETNEWIKDLDKKDTRKREERKRKR